MDEQTIQKLNQLNHKFYDKIAADFSETRQRPWEGWEQLLSIIKASFLEKPHMTVLDVGCGNGRFAEFLKPEIKPLEMKYVGLDSNKDLLEIAERNLRKLDFVSLQLKKVDILNDTLEYPADLICVFGVLHHIPGENTRQKLVKKLSTQLNKGGLLIFTAWQFDQLPNTFERRIKPTEIEEKLGIALTNLERNDYLLTWERGEHSIRFCHLIDDQEIEGLIVASGLKKLQVFSADGKNHVTNRYVVLQK